MTATAERARAEAADLPRRRRRPVLFLAALAAALSASLPVATGLGPVSVPAETVTRIIANGLFGFGEADWAPSAENIVWKLRVPRVLLGAFVGAALSLAGAAVQALARNPLADPYLLGISSGASAGAAAALLFGFGSGAGVFALTGSAFLGAVTAVALVFAAARARGPLDGGRLVFAGIAVGFALTALTNFLVFTSDSRDGARAVLFWTLGSLTRARWESVPIAAIAAAGALAVLFLWARKLDAIAIGDETALSLGTDPSRFRAAAALVIALAVAAAVAVSGAIGFVGLVVPHLARRVVGSAHRLVLPASALLGALLIVWADALARTAFAPRELPLGVLTAMLGTPLLIVLVRRLHRNA
ncbi:FecCD family ABC transporter permease [Salininema proteolyticum]|uniref:FecCD family ABC transporter permease n=1 Tax=Salininema proteolyticum TaxID=1607685 RepID=A0ABV8TTU1_9ACTN